MEAAAGGCKGWGVTAYVGQWRLFSQFEQPALFEPKVLRWEVHMGSLYGKFTWEVYIERLHGKSIWEVSMGSL
jgi:hypothetical protein